ALDARLAGADFVAAANRPRRIGFWLGRCFLRLCDLSGWRSGRPDIGAIGSRRHIPDPGLPLNPGACVSIGIRVVSGTYRRGAARPTRQRRWAGRVRNIGLIIVDFRLLGVAGVTGITSIGRNVVRSTIAPATAAATAAPAAPAWPVITTIFRPVGGAVDGRFARPVVSCRLFLKIFARLGVLGCSWRRIVVTVSRSRRVTLATFTAVASTASPPP